MVPFDNQTEDYYYFFVISFRRGQPELIFIICSVNTVQSVLLCCVTQQVCVGRRTT